MFSVIPDNKCLCTCSGMRNAEKIGEGIFGKKFKRRKNILASNLETYRSISRLKKYKLVNTVELIDVSKLKKIEDKIEIYTKMPLLDDNLADLIKHPQVQLSTPIVKYILYQLLKSISYIHGLNIIHLKLKPSNIFVTKDGVLKIGDFGIGCSFWLSAMSVCYPNEALSYRAPELLLGSQKYDRSVDMWSVGCIFAELCTRKDVFKSDCSQHQFELISDLCGSICPEVWPGVECLKRFKKLQLPQGVEGKLRMKMKGKVNGYFAINLLEKLLALDPKRRISANEALNHKYFDIKPRMDELSKILPILPEFTRKKINRLK